MRTPTIHLRWVAIALITAAAAALRLVDLGAVRLDPFYDAAVRSMGTSWHNFFFGAYEPGGSVSIDKPPLDLWLQVASVRLLGWSSTSLKLPEALAGTASVPLLYAAVRPPFGVLAGLVAAAALAVLPIEVITARSDTMDAVMMMLLVVALLAVVRACTTTGEGRSEEGKSAADGSATDTSGADTSAGGGSAGRLSPTAWLIVAAVALGLAFNVKLLESFVALPGLLAIAWLGMARAPGLSPSAERRHRAARLALAAAVYIVVALSWLSATLLVPADRRPYAIGSTDGSAWNAAFVFNGSERLTGKAVEVAGAGTVAAQDGGAKRAGATGTNQILPPSPTRLLARDGQLPARWLGWEALAALLLGAGVVLRAYSSRATRLQRATATGLFVWLLSGIVLFSAMARLHPRYVESFTPAVAAMFGIGVAWVVAGARGRVRLLAVPLTALLLVPLLASIEAVGDRTSDAGAVGALNAGEQRALSAYLRAHQAGARYELAAGSATSIASLIVQDQRPVVMLTTYNGLPLTSVTQLQALIARGEVRYAFLDSACKPSARRSTAGCAPAARWVRAHGSDVSRQAGLRAGGLLWRLPPPPLASALTRAGLGESPKAVA